MSSPKVTVVKPKSQEFSPKSPRENSIVEHLDISPVKKSILYEHASMAKAKPQPVQDSASKTPSLKISSQMSPQASKSFQFFHQEQPRKPPKPKVQVYPVDEALKHELLEWLKDYGLVRRKTSIKQLPQMCKDGVLFCQVVNRLNGRVEAIKGVHADSSRPSSVSVNLNKLLGYLRDQQKMNSRYLFASHEITEAQEDVIWGLLDDIKALYKGRQRSALKASQAQLIDQKRDEDYNTSSTHQRPMQTATSDSRLIYSPEVSFIDKTVSQSVKDEVIAWLTKLKLNHLIGHDTRHFLQDPVRNGVLLCELVTTLEKVTLIGLQWKPYSAQAALANVELALGVFRERRPVSMSLLNSAEEIVKGDAGVVWGLLSSLMKAYERAPAQPAAKSDLPYSHADIKKLEASLVNWLESLNVTEKPFVQLSTILDEIRSGVLLCSLVSKVTGVRILGVFKHPRTSQVALSNIRKALEVLRGQSRMSQEFTWREADLQDGNLTVVLGLLEDLHRFSDLLPPKKRGPGYHKDGPFLGKHGMLRSMSCSRDLSHQLEVLEIAHRQASVAAAPKPHPKPQHPFEIPSSSKTKSLLSTLGSPYRPSRVSNSELKGPWRFQLTSKKSLLNISMSSDRLCSTIDLAASKQFQWLDSLGIQASASIVLGEGIVEEYRSGVLLCEIIGKLETERLQGVNPFPKTTAAALYNITKALDHLRKKRGFPSQLTRVHNDLLKGDAYTLRKLMEAIEEIYKQKIQTLMKFHNRSQRLALSRSLDKGVLRELFLTSG